MLFTLPLCLALFGYELAMDRRVLYYQNLNEDRIDHENQIPIGDKKQKEVSRVVEETLGEININENGTSDLESSDVNENALPADCPPSQT